MTQATQDPSAPFQGNGASAPRASCCDAVIVAESAKWGKARNPLLSVVVPVFNTAPYVRRALDCLATSASRHHQIEVIVVHDGGSDGALSVAESWVRHSEIPACLIDQPNSGLSMARLSGLHHAHGLFLGFLDSDDFADVEVLLAMAAAALAHGCDTVICRSVIVDGATLRTAPFYDAWLWHEIMRGVSFRRLTLEQEPRLLRLEPNANTRILRRSFIDRVGIIFPPGLLFEDLPQHVRGISRAGVIGLFNETGYFYRINRPGKITDERSSRRFDILRSVALARDEALSAAVSDDAGANLTMQVTRMLHWCAHNVTNVDRPRFIAEAVAFMGTWPASWTNRALEARLGNERELILLSAFLDGQNDVLGSMAGRQRPGLIPILRFAISPHGAVVRRLALRIAGRITFSPARSGRRIIRKFGV